MSKTYRKLFNAFGLLIVFITLKACVAPEDSAVGTTTTEAPTRPATQALLLTQDFAFDAADKNKVTGTYKSHKSITVPADLTPQNKWIMFEGPVLENDKVAYRYYADSRHRFDIYGKKVSDLVMDTVSWKYHDIMDWGSDILKVGNSLGMGSPAIYYEDKVYALENAEKKTIEVVESGADQSMIRTSWTGLEVAGEKIDLVQDWSIAAGDYHSTIHLYVPGGQLPEGMKFATGIVSHLPDATSGTAGNCTYLMNWGKQSYHEEQLGMAVFADNAFKPMTTKDDLSHLLVLEGGADGATYGFMAVWEQDQSGTKNAAGFKTMVEAAAK